MREVALAASFLLVTIALLLALPSETQQATVATGPELASSDRGALASAKVDPPTNTAAFQPEPASTETLGRPSATTPATNATLEATVSPSTATTISPSTATANAPTPVVAVSSPDEPADPRLQIELAFVSEIDDVTTEQLADFSLAVLNDPRSWGQAGFSFVANPQSDLRVVLAEGGRVDALCLPLRTLGTVSCQNGPVVALNATRWREATTTWDATVEDYRRYLVNHEVGHLIGQRHPTPRCPLPGAPAAVMEQQTKGLEGCTGNWWPRPWEVTYAAARPAKIAPLPSWAPDPVPSNLETAES